MYTTYFNLREMPFSIAPDPAYLYLSPRHQEALGHLLYGTGQYGGFVQLTGEVGTGKTTIVRTLLSQRLDQVDVAMIHNPRQSEQEFVQSLCDELGVAYDRSHCTLKTLVDALNAHLLQSHAAGRRTVLIIDEAQQLSPDVLEQVRLLTNLETSKEKLLRIMLIGQPELADLLARQDLRQLAQRITARYHLTPLQATETSEYIAHRLHVAGGSRDLFDPAAVQRVHRDSGGIPRLINVLCDRALLGAYAQGLPRVNAALVRQAADELRGHAAPAAHGPVARGATGSPLQPWLRGGEALLLVAAVVVAGLLAWQRWSPEASPAAGSPPVLAASAPPAPEGTAPTVATGPDSSASVPAASTTAALLPQTAPASGSSAGQTALSGVASDKPTPPAAPLTPVVPDPASAAAAAPAPALRRAYARLNDLIPLLAAQWQKGITFKSSERPCLTTHRERLECLRGNGEWADLRAMNVPAVLSFNGGSGTLYYALLLGLDHDHATLALPKGGQIQIPLKTLESAWSGEFLVLWRRETEGLAIAPASSGDAVRWLREQLSKHLGHPVGTAGKATWDEALQSALQAFQTTLGLVPDGVAGPRTLLALSSRPTPSLTHRTPSP